MKKKTVKEFTIDEKAKQLKKEIDAYNQKEAEEVAQEIQLILQKKGFKLSAQMILQEGKAPIVQPLIVKVNDEVK